MKLHNCSAELRKAKLRATPARIVAMQIFEKSDIPVDSTILFKNLKKQVDVDRVTVFRMLNNFLDRGLIKKIEFGEGKSRYELNGPEHHHLICESCGNVEDISYCNVENFGDEVNRQKKFLIRRHTLEFYGLCNNCQK